MRKPLLACGLAIALCATLEGSAAADLRSAALVLDSLPTASASQAVDPSHFVYIPVIGPWLDLGKLGPAPGSLVFDGLCQDFVALTFVAGALSRGEPAVHSPPWRVLPWFPRSGGGGLSLSASF
jgi:hypothetical protein